jgi:hypothetical protein
VQVVLELQLRQAVRTVLHVTQELAPVSANPVFGQLQLLPLLTRLPVQLRQVVADPSQVRHRELQVAQALTPIS